MMTYLQGKDSMLFDSGHTAFLFAEAGEPSKRAPVPAG
jgi:hypothetical protein